jgi:hypothetical protein
MNSSVGDLSGGESYVEKMEIDHLIVLVSNKD